MGTCDWEESCRAVVNLEKTLRCTYCNCLLQDPCTLGNCDHLFCRICIKDFVDKEHCPSCQAPAWARDLKVNRELASVVQLFRKLRKIVNSRPELPASGSTGTEDLEDEDSLIPEIDVSDEECEDGNEDESALLEREKDVNQVVDVVVKTRGRALKDKNNGGVTNLRANRRKRQLSKKKKQSEDNNVEVNNKPGIVLDDENDPYAIYEQITSPRREKRAKVVRQQGKTNEKDQSTRGRKTTRGRRTKKAIQKRLEKANNAWNQMDKESKSSASLSGRKRVIFSDRGSDEESGMDIEVAPAVVSGSDKRVARRGRAARSPRETSKVQDDEQKRKRGRKKIAIDEDSGCMTGSTEPSIEAVIKPAPKSIMKRNIRGETPLHLACIKGDLVLVQELLQKGSDPNVKDHAGWTPLHEACNHGFVEIVAALLDNGALINMPGFDNDSPLHDAVASNRPNIVKLLIERGASLDVRNIHGNTPKDLLSSEEVMNALKTKPGVTSDLNTSFTSSISSSPASSQKIVLLGTGLNDKQRNKLQSCARLLRGKVTSDFTQNITHLVANAASEGRCSRTMKFLQAVLLGKWVVNFSWVEECLKGKGLVPEVNHEICGTMIDSDSEGARKSREMANSQFPPLFDGCHFYIHGNFSPPTPPKEELASLLKLGGGTILTRYPKPDDDVIQASTIVPYHAKPESELASCSYYIIYDTGAKRKNTPPRVRTAKLCTVPVSWVMDCISRYELQELPS
ncbi:putative BRCA1-associated RING domain protein 1 [Apostichopus japonicus]|uniref:Putative BRCA1-associated RING domain protein 1 n=1 Tax=Stichopus japonicus TaxID=307972 RepID=A0A2G8KGW0_STIJA|nr:putative BRCA1-associated RING domain protein 1 [Apostichopus japonicus]